LNQPDSHELPFGGAGHDGLHQLAACGAILYHGVNRDWSNAGNRSSFIQTVASDNSSTLLSHHAEKTWVREHHREEADRNAGVRKILRETVVIGEGAERFKANFPARFGVGWNCLANYKRLLAGVEGLRLSCHEACLLAELAGRKRKREFLCLAIDRPAA
jgi:hypothetical protein